MTWVVLDSSAVLAVLRNEPGGDVVVPFLTAARLSAANLTEVLTRLIDLGSTHETARRSTQALAIEIDAVDADLAIHAAALRETTRSRGLSPGDRLCLALAQRLNVPVYTADRAWAGLDIGIDIRLIR